MEKIKKGPSINIISVLSLCFVYAGAMALNVILSAISAEFPEIPVSTIYQLRTVPSLITMIILFTLSPMIGKKIPFKAAFLIGSGSVAICGTACVYFINARMFWLMYVCLLIAGAGASFVGFQQPALMTMTSTPSEGAKYIGWNVSFSTGISIFTASLAGWLASINLSLAFLCYTLSIVPFLLIMFAYKDKIIDKQETAAASKVDDSQSAQKEKIPGRIFLIIFISTIATIVGAPSNLNFSFICTVKGFNITLVGLMTSATSLGMAAMGFFASKVETKLKKFTTPLVLLLYMLGVAVYIYSNSIVLFFIAKFFGGIAGALTLPVYHKYISAIAPSSRKAMLATWLLASSYLASYAMGPFLQIASLGSGDLIYMPMKVSIVVYAVLTVVVLMFNIRPKELDKEAA